MKLLLDTHIWVWALTRPEKLHRTVRREIEKHGNELHLSPISIWEAQHLALRKRLPFHQSFPEWISRVLSQFPVREAPLTFAVAAEASRIELPHADPGDILLAATASVFDLTLVTADAQLLACSWLKTLANE